MKKRGYRLLAMGLAALLALQTPTAAALQSDMRNADRIEEEAAGEESFGQPDTETQEEVPEQEDQTDDRVDIQTKEYTWKYDAEIGWQLWSSDENEEEILCGPGIYILNDGIYYLKEYETQEEEDTGEQKKPQGVLTEGSVSVTKETTVVSEKEEDFDLKEGIYYFSYDLDNTEETPMPENGKYFTDTWVHPGEEGSVWYYVNKEGLQELPKDHAGPMQNETGYYYLNEQGESQSGKYVVDGKLYTYNGSGQRFQLKDGWEQDHGEWYYIENSKIATGWKKIRGSWYYLSLQNGVMQKGFFKDHTGTLYYTDGSGRMISGNGWKKIGGSWYWFRSSGAIVRGWIRNQGKWYYLDEKSGAMKTGWYQVKGIWYYSDSSGAMKAGGWFALGRKWYYLNKSGAMQTGWLKRGKTWYYLDEKSGAMKTGWYQVKEIWYYSNSSGAMQTGWLKQGKIWYYLNSSGAAVTGWQSIRGTWYYFYPNCSMAANTWIDNYYVNSSGAWTDSTVVMPGAVYNYPFPTASTKKGLQIKDDLSDGDMVEDAANLGVKHAVINIALNYAAFGSGIEYEYEGQTYYMNTGYIHELDAKIKKLHDKGMIITAVLVLQWDYQKQDLILPGARTYGYNLYGWNTVESAGRKHLEAICSFLAERYTAPDMGVVNWICGNEVNAWKDYHYSGSLNFNQYMEYYAQAYQLLYKCVKHAYANGRVYLSIDHTWTYDKRANCYTGKSVLDRFAQLMKQKKISDWMIAFHPYPTPELQSDFWNRTLNVTDSENSPIITMANLSSFTNYVKKHYGEGRRVLLSECGFTSVTNGIERQDIQAAAIAYGYYLAEANDMVDSFVVHRQVDHSVETKQGFHLGLWTCKPGTTETAYKKKQAYDVFKYMDTKGYMKYTRFALPLIKKTSWEQAVPGFDPSKFR